MSRSGSNTTRNYISHPGAGAGARGIAGGAAQQQQHAAAAARCVYKNEDNYKPAGAGASSSAWLVLIPSCQQRGVVALLGFGFWLLVRPRAGQRGQQPAG